MRPGTRVLAIQQRDESTVYVYGEGTYLGNRHPDVSWLPDDFVNPCIQLDDGHYVWGFECWWGELDRFKEQNGDREVVKVDVIDEIFPKS